MYGTSILTFVFERGTSTLTYNYSYSNNLFFERIIIHENIIIFIANINEN